MAITTGVAPTITLPFVAKPATAVPIPSPEPSGGGGSVPTSGQIWPRGNRS